MKRRLLWIIFMALCINGMIAFDGNAAPIISEDEALARAWSELKASDVQMNLNVYGKVNDSYSDKDEIERILFGVASILELPTDLEIAYTEYDAFCEGIIHYTEDGSIAIDIAVQTFADSCETVAETGLVINIDRCGNVELLLQYKTLLEQCMRDLGIDNQVHYTLLGRITELNDVHELMCLIEKAMRAMQAMPRDFYMDKYVLSVSAMSPLLETNDYGWDFNFQLAVRRDEEEGCYHVWMGFPAIGQSF